MPRLINGRELCKSYEHYPTLIRRLLPTFRSGSETGKVRYRMSFLKLAILQTKLELQKLSGGIFEVVLL